MFSKSIPALAGIAFIAFTVSASAQSSGAAGTIDGLVTDPAGSIIPGAQPFCTRQVAASTSTIQTRWRWKGACLRRGCHRDVSRQGQTGYSHPIPKAGIGGSPRFAAHTLVDAVLAGGQPIGPSRDRFTRVADMCGQRTGFRAFAHFDCEVPVTHRFLRRSLFPIY